MGAEGRQYSHVGPLRFEGLGYAEGGSARRVDYRPFDPLVEEAFASATSRFLVLFELTQPMSFDLAFEGLAPGSSTRARGSVLLNRLEDDNWWTVEEEIVAGSWTGLASANHLILAQSGILEPGRYRFDTLAESFVTTSPSTFEFTMGLVAVPEPGTGLLVGLGLVFLGARRSASQGRPSASQFDPARIGA